VFQKILDHYSEAHRRYHTPEHIEHCLTQFDMAADLMDDPDAVEMALWFHDVIYDVPTARNEARSAEFFSELTHDRIGPEFGRSICDMILITAHQEMPRRKDDKYIVDVDLSSFGLPWEEFKRDSENVRSEFACRTDAEFYSAHIKFMRSLVKRPRFFATGFFREKYEKSARGNIERLIAELNEAGFH
jgi:predicted metal-dependent HD superfamily phosphohydrolase